jgi:hypothetical protein
LRRHLAAQFSGVLEDCGVDAFRWFWIGHGVILPPPLSPPRRGEANSPPFGGS